MKKTYLLLSLLCVSSFGFSQDFKLDFEGVNPLSNAILAPGVTHVNATASGTGATTAYVLSKISGSNLYTNTTQVENVVEVDPNNSGNKILKMDYLGHIMIEEAALGTGSWSVSGYINGNAYGANPQNVGFMSVTGLDATLTAGVHRILYRYGNGEMMGLMSIPASTGFSMLNTVLLHFVFTFDASDNMYRMYRNGALVGTSAAQPVWTGKKVYLGYGGGTQDLTTGAFTGPLLDTTTDPIRNKDLQTRVDDLSVFKRALTETEALALFNGNTLSVNNRTLESFNSYPNPVKDHLYFSTYEITSVEIYNILGSKVSSQKVNNGVDTSSLSNGVYVVKCQNDKGVTIGTLKVVKE